MLRASIILLQVWVFICCRGVFNADTTHTCGARGVELPWDPIPASFHSTTVDGAFQSSKIHPHQSNRDVSAINQCYRSITLALWSLGLSEYFKLSICALELYLERKIGITTLNYCCFLLLNTDCFNFQNFLVNSQHFGFCASMSVR